jgi:drug/metabolite transporter superfamily protein YnfA
MKTNMGFVDKVIRVIVAFILSALYFTKTVEGTFGIVLLAVGGIFIFTSIIGFCPLYKIIGISTCPVKKK